MSEDIVRFGKYKGQSVFSLAVDKNYTDWLLSQPWFKSQHQEIYNIVINNFRQPSETPEHNAMQIKFLDETYALKLAYLLEPKIFDCTSKQLNKYIADNFSEHLYERVQRHFKNIYPSYDGKDIVRISDMKFENSCDVSYDVCYGFEKYHKNNDVWEEYGLGVAIEIKPTIGDDFPAVIRQMNASMKNCTCSFLLYKCLLVGEYTGIGATKEQFVQFFSTQGYRVFFESQIDSVELPEHEKQFKLDNNIFEKIHAEIEERQKQREEDRNSLRKRRLDMK